MPFIKNLATLGIDARLRIVDAVQMQRRRNEFDFDLTIQRFGFSATPGDSLRNYFSSQAAAVKGSQNLAGIADPAIDALIDSVIAANSRAELTMACRALDRVIRPAAIGFRTGTKRRTGSHIGIRSGGRRPSRAMLGGCRKRGGTIPAKRPK